MSSLQQRSNGRARAHACEYIAEHMRASGARPGLTRSWERQAKRQTPKSLLHKGGKP